VERSHVTRIHEGGISTNPIGLIATVIATAMNIRDIQLLRACDDLFRDMVKTIPTPTIAEALRPPVITLLVQDTKNLPRKQEMNPGCHSGHVQNAGLF